MDRQLRARLLLGEAEALGIGLADLVAASQEEPARAPMLTEFVNTIAAAFTPGTAATYGSYWRLVVAYLGDRRLDDIAVLDLQAVVDAAVARARGPDPTAPAALHVKAASPLCVPCSRVPLPPAGAPPTPPEGSRSRGELVAGDGPSPIKG